MILTDNQRVAPVSLTVVSLISIFIFPTICTDIFIPAFFNIQEHYLIGETVVAINSAYLLGLGIGSIIFGILLDLGKHSISLHIGSFFFIITGFFIYFFGLSFEKLLILRLIQGFFGSVCVISVPPLIVKFSSLEGGHRSISLLNAFASIALIAAPLISQFIIKIGVWSDILLFCSLGHFLLWIPLLLLHRKSFSPECAVSQKFSLSKYLFLVRSSDHTLLLAITCLAYAAFVIFLAFLPFILNNVGTENLPLLQSILMLSHFLGSISNFYLANKIGSASSFRFGRRFLLMGSLAIVAGLTLDQIMIIFLGLIAIYFSLAYVLSYLTSLRLQRFSAVSGASYSFGLIVRYLISAALIQSISVVSSHHVGISAIIISLGLLSFCWIASNFVLDAKAS